MKNMRTATYCDDTILLLDEPVTARELVDAAMIQAGGDVTEALSLAERELGRLSQSIIEGLTPFKEWNERDAEKDYTWYLAKDYVDVPEAQEMAKAVSILWSMRRKNAVR